MGVRAVLFKAFEVRLQFRTFFPNKGSTFISNLNDNFCEDFSDVYYVSVHQKIDDFRILPFFKDFLMPFSQIGFLNLTIKNKVEILSFNMRYYIYMRKL